MLSRVSFIANAYDVWKENLDKVQNALVDFEAKAKDLGVNPMDFKGYSDAYYQSKDYVDEVQELSDKIKQMQTLYQKLKPELKSKLKYNSIKYKSGPRQVIAELHRFSNYSELTVGTVKDLVLYSDIDDRRWSSIDWRYGDKLFND